MVAALDTPAKLRQLLGPENSVRLQGDLRLALQAGAVLAAIMQQAPMKVEWTSARPSQSERS
jgi:hypothetical protein